MREKGGKMYEFLFQQMEKASVAIALASYAIVTYNGHTAFRADANRSTSGLSKREKISC